MNNDNTVNEQNAMTAKQQLAVCLEENRELRDRLRISEKQYEVALLASGLTMFEYNILTKDLTLFGDISEMYNMPSIIPNGVETLIKTGIIEPNSVNDYRELYRRIHAGEPFGQCYINTRAADGVIHDFRLSLTTVYDDENTPIRAIGVRENVSQLLQLQKEQQFGDTMVRGKQFLCEADITLDIVININKWPGMENVKPGSSFSAAIDQVAHTLVSQEHCELMCNSLSLHNLELQYAKGNSLFSFSYLRRDQTHNYIWYEITVNIIMNRHTGRLNIRVYHADIGDRMLAELALRYDAEHDKMTALLNKSTTQERITTALENASREQCHAFMIVDLDNFKSVNDSFGHLFGDDVIIELAHRLKSVFRKGDIVGRIGGDEFCVFLKDIKLNEVALQKAEEVCKSLAVDYIQKDVVVRVSASVGVALFGVHGKSFDQLYKAADKALYEAKRTGKSRFMVVAKEPH